LAEKNVWEKRPYCKDKISQMTEQSLAVVLTTTFHGKKTRKDEPRTF